VCLAAVAISAFWALGSTPAQAIPSPELVIGSFVSLSQLLALASAVLGGGAAYATMRARRGGGGGVERPEGGDGDGRETHEASTADTASDATNSTHLHIPEG